MLLVFRIETSFLCSSWQEIFDWSASTCFRKSAFFSKSFQLFLLQSCYLMCWDLDFKGIADFVDSIDFTCETSEL